MIVESPITCQNSPFLMGGVIIAFCRWVRRYSLLLKTFGLSINSFVGLRIACGRVFVFGNDRHLCLLAGVVFSNITIPFFYPHEGMV